MLSWLRTLFIKPKGPEYYLSNNWRCRSTQEAEAFRQKVKEDNWPRVIHQLSAGCFTLMDWEPSLHKRLYKVEGWYWPEMPLASSIGQKYIKHQMLKRVHANEENVDYSLYYYGAYSMTEKRSMGFTLGGDDFMEKSGRQIAEDMFISEGVSCQITKIYADGSDGGNSCFCVDVEMDTANAVKWDSAFE